MASPLILCLLMLFNVVAQAKPATDEPETKVQISIYDLVGKHRITKAEQRAGLDSQYVEEVIKAMRLHRQEMLSCLNENETMRAELRLEIAATGEAKASSRNPGNTMVECAIHQLDAVHFPKHRINRIVQIDFPLVLEKRTL